MLEELREFEEVDATPPTVVKADRRGRVVGLPEYVNEGLQASIPWALTRTCLHSASMLGEDGFGFGFEDRKYGRGRTGLPFTGA